jgi:acylphosphatase
VPRKHVFVHGRVQGVAFRAYAHEVATHLGVRGWIRNRADGRRVELEVEADDEPLQTYLEWLHEGPALAQVEQVEVADSEDEDPLAPFEVRPTA